MTFTHQIKEEIIKNEYSLLDYSISLNSFLKFGSSIKEDEITITTENPAIAKWLFSGFKSVYNINADLRIVVNKKTKMKSYILSTKEKLDKIKTSVSLEKNNILDASDEERIYYLKGLFLLSGNITDPKKNLYHLEVILKNNEDALLINDIFLSLDFSSNVISKNNEYMVYIKKSENISDFLKYINAYHSLFYFEDIRIYKDHKNMVNRINNCEQANTEKSYNSSMEILENIKYLEDNDFLLDIDKRTHEIIEYKKKYPETTLSELAEIISIESEKSISKSGVYHHFRKIKNITKKHKDN